MAAFVGATSMTAYRPLLGNLKDGFGSQASRHPLEAVA